MTNGYFARVVTDMRSWCRHKLYFGLYWSLRRYFFGLVKRAHSVACFFGWHTKKIEFTVRYHHLKLKVCECARCGTYIENGARIATEVEYDKLIPFEGFKIEALLSSDPASPFYSEYRGEKVITQIVADAEGHFAESELPEATADGSITIELTEAERPE